MSDLSQTILDAPSASLIPVGLLFVCGLVLWMAGRRVVRPGFAAIGIILGGALGFGVGNAGDLGVDPWVAAGTGAVVVGLIAALAYRFALAAVIGLLFAALAPLSVRTAADLGAFDFAMPEGQQPLFVEAQEPPEGLGESDASATEVGLSPELTDWLEGVFEPPVDLDPEDLPGLPMLVALVEEVRRLARSAWEQSPAALRGSLLAALVIGAMLGFVVGTTAPVFSASAVSALGGSAICLASAWIMASRFGKGDVGWMPHSATAWTAVWLITATVGTGIQWTFRSKRADNSAS